MGNFDKVLIDYCIFCTRTNEKCSKCTKSRIDLRRELNAVSVRELTASRRELQTFGLRYSEVFAAAKVKFAKQVKFAPKAQGWKNCNLSLICHSERSEESGNTNTTPTAQPIVGQGLAPAVKVNCLSA